MSCIIGIEKIYEIYPKWKPSDLAFITGLHYFCDSEGCWCLLLTGLFKEKSDYKPINHSTKENFFKIQIQFSGIHTLNLEGVMFNPISISGFDILDISDRGWEKVHFSIGDYEDDRISFFCENIEIRAIEEV